MKEREETSTYHMVTIELDRECNAWVHYTNRYGEDDVILLNDEETERMREAFYNNKKNRETKRVMAIIRNVRGKTPKIGERTFLAETAVLIGDVTVGRDCSIWYGAVLRGDVNTITIGDRTNIQDGAVIHTLYDESPNPSQTHIGSDVSVGHNAIIHGAVIEDKCLIGMGATILDGAHVPSGCIIAAGALVLSGARLEPNSVYAGVPVKKVKEITTDQRRDIVERTASDYRLYASWYGGD